MADNGNNDMLKTIMLMNLMQGQTGAAAPGNMMGNPLMLLALGGDSFGGDGTLLEMMINGGDMNAVMAQQLASKLPPGPDGKKRVVNQKAVLLQRSGVLNIPPQLLLAVYLSNLTAHELYKHYGVPGKSVGSPDLAEIEGQIAELEATEKK